ncbi:MAG: outer membrane protein assembly factor BamA [Verrucomicrobiota bacterium]|nr:outer membrane protein assembly factor BamA [Verrucomicrobiota bacterium]
MTSHLRQLIQAAFIFLFLVLGQSVLHAEKITDISIQYAGAQTVDRAALITQIRSKVGSELDAMEVEKDIKNLYSSGLVDNVRVLTEPHDGGVRVIFLVRTRAILGEVSFIGNSLATNRLRKETELEIGEAFDDTVLETARVNLEDLYKRKGFSNVGITYKVDGAERPGFSRVTFVVDEGVLERLNKIKFYGNESISDRLLSGQMHVKASRAYNIFKKNQGIDSSELEEDIVRIEEYYRNEGYINARVTDVVREPAGSKVDLVIHINEGNRFTVNEVSVSGIKAVSQKDVLPLLEMREGAVYSSESISTDLVGLRRYYSDNGYSNVRISPRVDAASETMINIEYAVSEGVQSTVELINISGNDRTMDKVIRRELALSPGDVYNETRLEVSRNRLMGLGFFDGVNVTPSDSETPDHTDINIVVREKSTGTVNFGAGFSSIDNLVGFMDIVQTNFRLFGKPHAGAGEKIRFGVQYGRRRKDFQFDYTQPWLFDKKLALGTGLYYRDLLYLSYKYDQTIGGGYMSLRKPLGEYTTLSFKTSLENYQIDVDSDSSNILKEEEGEYDRALFAVNYVIDTTDSQYLTRRGHRLSLGTDVSFGDVETYGVQLSGSKYFLLPFDTVLSINGQYRTVDGDDNVPIFEREFLGGARNLRGYEYREASSTALRDEQGEPLGGRTAAYFTAEYSFPLVNLKKFRGHVFYDGGILSKDSWDFGGDYLSDYGFGVDLYLPMGPIRLDVAWPMQTNEWVEDKMRFQFNMGYQFR